MLSQQCRHQRTDRNIKINTQKARAAFLAIGSVWKSHTHKLRLFNSNVISVEQCGSESQKITKTIIKQQIFINWCLHRIADLKWFDRNTNADKLDGQDIKETAINSNKQPGLAWVDLGSCLNGVRRGRRSRSRRRTSRSSRRKVLRLHTRSRGCKKKQIFETQGIEVITVWIHKHPITVLRNQESLSMSLLKQNCLNRSWLHTYTSNQGRRLQSIPCRLGRPEECCNNTN